MVSGFIGWSRDKRGVPTYHCVDVCNTITSQMGGTTTPLVHEYKDNLSIFDMETKDSKYVEFKESVIRYAIDHKLYSGEEHDYTPTAAMLADERLKDRAHLIELYKYCAETYGADKAMSCPMFRIRKLTPRECFRLMDVDDADIDKIYAYRFPDGDYETDCNGKEIINTETGKRQKHRIGTKISDSKKYQLAGNSIVVNCMYHIFDNLFVHPTFSDAVKEGFKVDNNGQMSLF